MSRIVPISILLFLVGCATIDQEQREYERVEYLETKFKPGVAACIASGRTLVYDGPYSQRMRRILDTQDWDKLHRSETIHFACMERT